MNATVTALRPPRSVYDLEAKLVGAVMHLGPAAAFLEAMALSGEEFTVELHQRVWKAARRQAEAGVRVTHETIASAGLRRKLLTPEDARQLEQLAGTNELSLDTFRAVAAEFKLAHQATRTAAALETEAKAIRAGQFDPAAVAGRLSGIERELHRENALISDLTEDQQRMLDRWDVNQRTGKSDILATGIKVLDAEIGGLPQRLCLFAADAGVGKTALIDSMQHAMLMVHPELKLGLISPEDGVEHVPKRWMARETGWILRDIGNRARTAEEELRVGEIAERHHALLKRILGYRERSITADQLIALCWQMRERGAGCIFIDNFNKITLRGSDDYHERVQRFSDRLSEFAEKAKCPAVLVVHMTGDDTNQKGKNVTASGGLQGGRALGRDARFRIDLFRHNGELRGVIAKANELGEQGAVIQFSRQATAGLIDPDTGERIDVEAEAAAVRQRRSEQRIAEQMAAKKLKDKLTAQEKAAAAPAPAEPAPVEPQPSLFGGDHDAE